jgi:hypothetical protein
MNADDTDKKKALKLKKIPDTLHDEHLFLISTSQWWSSVFEKAATVSTR